MDELNLPDKFSPIISQSIHSQLNKFRAILLEDSEANKITEDQLTIPPPYQPYKAKLPEMRCLIQVIFRHY